MTEPDDYRAPYVGAGADGSRRSAQIDREEADVERDPERRELILASAARWEEQARRLERRAIDRHRFGR